MALTPSSRARPQGRTASEVRERYGEVEIERHTKDDGRALILYTSAQDRHAKDKESVSEQGSGGGGGRHASFGRPAGVSELRFDELRGEHVVYAIERQERTFLPPSEHCPLCPMVRADRPTEIPFAQFEIAVFENRFPALRPPNGASEVVVYSDGHRGSFAALVRERAHALMWVWRHRYLELAARPDVQYVFVFENRGVEVGVTLHHPHGQVYAYPFLPPVPALELEADERFGGCAVCELSRRELRDGRRVVYENDGVVAYIPFAARWAYETHVVAREHKPSLLECDPRELCGLADALQALTRGYDELFQRPFPYVMAMHQAPADGRAKGHLHVELYTPLRTAHKLKYLAGSEQGAGTFIADTLPEDSARALRKAILDAA